MRDIDLRADRTKRMIAAFGERKAMGEWALDPRCAVSYTTLVKRLGKGWAPEKAIATPPANPRPGISRGPQFEAFGETKSAGQWIRDPRCTVPPSTVRSRIAAGWDLERALTVAPSRRRGAVKPGLHPVVEQLVRLRLESDLTIDQVARLLGVSEDMLYQYQCGAIMPSVGRLEAWARVLGARLEVSVRGDASVRTDATCTSLSPRQQQILELLADGASSAQMAERLGLSVLTVREYRDALYERLGVHSDGHAVAEGFRRGLLSQ